MIVLPSYQLYHFISHKADSRWVLNNAIAVQFPERSVTVIKIHRASRKYKELVRTLRASDDFQLHTTRLTLQTQLTNIIIITDTVTI